VGTSVPLLDVDTLFAPLVWSPTQPIRVAVLLTGPMIDPVRELGQDLKPSGDLARRLGSLAQPNQGGMVRTQPEPSAV